MLHLTAWTQATSMSELCCCYLGGEQATYESAAVLLLTQNRRVCSTDHQHWSAGLAVNSTGLVDKSLGGLLMCC
jgi:hypothetical protein